jgi:ParB family transcriptional regulator, chromosome partitioning protein
MATAQPKITLSASRDIPFNKLVLSQANVRTVKTGQSIEELAEDIARRTLLQSLSVRPIRDADGKETGLYEVPAGGRRFRALELLVKQKRLAKDAPVPCVIRTNGLAEEDSLAENVQRAALHPLDQFRAFAALRGAGLGDEEIAARFFVTPAVVRQRLKLAAVSPKLLDLYVDDKMTLEQLMAFSVTNDQARQEQVWDGLAQSYNKEAYIIRRLLTEGAVRATDKRVRFIGIAAYEAAGGIVLRDLFQDDNGGWLQDPALLTRLTTGALEDAAATVRAEGWKWVETAIEFPFGHTHQMRRLPGRVTPLTEAEQANLDALRDEYQKIEAAHAGSDDLPDDVDQRLGEIEEAMEALENPPVTYDPADMSRAGVFVSLDTNGTLKVERGYVRREDDRAVYHDPEVAAVHTPDAPDVVATPGANPTDPPEDEDGVRPLSERLIIELTAHRTLALRNAVASDPDMAFLAVLYTLCLKIFYRYTTGSCLGIEIRLPMLPTQTPGLADSRAAQAISTRQDQWAAQLPQDEADLWTVLCGFDSDSRAALFAHCVAETINALHDSVLRPSPRLAHVDQLAVAVGLDMAAAGWTPTVANYLGRVPKPRILEAVRESKGDTAADLIDHLRKLDMAQEAERLLAGTGWLPEVLRAPQAVAETQTDDAELPDFLVEAAE